MPSYIKLSLLLCVFTFSVANACTCREAPLEERLKQATTVFHAKATHIEDIPNPDDGKVYFNGGVKRGYFEIIKTFKGDPTQIPYINSALEPNGGSCELELTKGNFLIITDNPKAPVAHRLCGGLISIENNPDVLSITEVILEAISSNSGD